jgi:hypothetical protein
MILEILNPNTNSKRRNKSKVGQQNTSSIPCLPIKQTETGSKREKSCAKKKKLLNRFIFLKTECHH